MSTNFRYERKYRITTCSYDVVKSIVEQHPAFFQQHYSDRYVNNIYFDTFQRKFFNENLDGISVRTKPRIRWYGNQFGIMRNPILEFKHKKNALGTKYTYNLKGSFVLKKTVSSNELIEFIKHSRIPDRAATFMKMLQPALLNNYLRSYYISSDGKFRLTIDRHINYFALNSVHNQLPRPQVDDSVVLEVKYDEANSSVADEITSHIRFNITKSSKYVTGIIMTNR
jgi:SPX domain protein involved in polyphosphate accumulation